MGSTIMKALFFFLPAYSANAAPVIFARFNWWKNLAFPVDLNMKSGGIPIFGVTKTVRGILAGILAGIIVALIQYFIHEISPWREYVYLYRYTLENSLALGFLMGLGEGAGDLIKSCVKRRMGIKSGGAVFPLDQTSFLGALLLSFIVYIPSGGYLLAIVIISPFIPVIANLIAYKAKLKKVWW